MQFTGQAFTVGQQLAFSFAGKKLLGIVIKSLEGNFCVLHIWITLLYISRLIVNFVFSC